MVFKPYLGFLTLSSLLVINLLFIWCTTDLFTPKLLPKLFLLFLQLILSILFTDSWNIFLGFKVAKFLSLSFMFHFLESLLIFGFEIMELGGLKCWLSFNSPVSNIFSSSNWFTNDKFLVLGCGILDSEGFPWAEYVES